MKIKLLICCVLFGLALQAQKISTLEITPLEIQQDGHINIVLPQHFENIDFTSLAIASLQNLDNRLTYQLEDFQGNSYPVQNLAQFDHSVDQQQWIAEQLFVDSDIKSIRLETTTPLSSSLSIRFFQMPIKERSKLKLVYSPEKACPCPQPGYLDRAGWCPDGDCPPHPDPEFTEVNHIIIHHAASTNISANWPGIVEGIWDFHVNGNGWSDIGYNWLIDPEGIIYEGRGDDIQGAHHCGANSNTAGICLLGNFTNQLPEGPAIASLIELVAWKSCDRSIDPLESAFHPSSNKVIPNIAGHRDGCATECPGDQFYPTLIQLREDIQDQISFACANLPAPTNLAGTTESSTSIALNWDDNAFDETAYLLERAQWTNQNYEQIASLSEDTDTYIDENLEANTVYFYRVRATNGVDTTTYSNEIGLSTVLQSTTELAALNISIFPNPAIDFININFEKSAINLSNITIHNTIGQQVWSTKKIESNLLQISTKPWPKGTYLIHFNFADRSIHYPILIH